MTLNERAIGIMSIAINVILTKVPVYCSASKRTLPQWCVKTNDHLAITFVNFFHEKYLYGNTRLLAFSALCAGEAPDEKLKINKLGPHHSAALWPLIMECISSLVTLFVCHICRVTCDLDIFTKIVWLHIKS